MSRSSAITRRAAEALSYEQGDCEVSQDSGQGRHVQLAMERASMSKSPPNHGKPWTSSQDNKLRQEARGNTPTRVIGLHMGRTPGAIYNRASELGVSVKPTNQSPYGTAKKK